MQESRVARVSILSAAMFLGSFQPAAAKETYSLRGEGAKPGTAITQQLVLKVQTITSAQGRKSDTTVFSKAEGQIQVLAVDTAGDIREANELYTGATSATGQPKRLFPSLKMHNRVVLCRLEEGVWTAALDQLSGPEEVQNELSDLPMPGLERSILPAAQVPVGHTWTFGPATYADLLATQLPNYARQLKGLTGKASCTFEKVGSVEGVRCAYLKMTFSFKGTLVTDDVRAVPMSVTVTGQSSEVRRLDAGVLVKQETSLEIRGREHGASRTMVIERAMTQKLTPPPPAAAAKD